MRRTFHDPASVSAKIRSPSETAHTGVATPVPSRLNVVTLTKRPGNVEAAMTAPFTH
jgi:hypothetical protein